MSLLFRTTFFAVLIVFGTSATPQIASKREKLRTDWDDSGNEWELAAHGGQFYVNLTIGTPRKFCKRFNGV
jgi:hypothetical protein